jgi:glutaredoxin-like protein NrdH
MANNNILIYTLSTCSHCKATKELLSECNAEYDNITVDELTGESRKEILCDLKAINPRCSFPTTKIDEIIIIGYKEKQIKEALGIIND